MAPADANSPENSLSGTSQLRLADLSKRKTHDARWRPDAQELAALAEDLGLLDLKKAVIEGTLIPVGREDWDFTGRVGATVTQACVVTLAPVVTRIDEKVGRKFRSDLPEIDTEDEVEMPEDDALEPLRSVIDLRRILQEELSLALPPYPRAPDAELGETNFTEPGRTPLRDEDTKPFAGLADLKRQMDEPREK